MHKVWVVIRREFIARVRTRAFVIGTVLFPLVLGALMVVPILLASRETAAKRLVVLDAASGKFGERIASALAGATRGAGGEGPHRYEVSRIEAGDRLEPVRDSLVRLIGVKNGAAPAIDGVLVPTDEGLAAGRLDYLGSNVGSPGEMQDLERTLQPVVLVERLQRAGVEPAVVLPAVGRVDLVTAKVSEGRLTGESGEASFLLAYIMTFVLYFALLIYGMQVMTSVVEEKTNRIAEVLASSLTPFQMMLGKVLGVGAVGLLQIGIWAGTATVLTTYRGAIGAAFGAPAGAAAALPIPTMRPDLLAVFLLFFVLGFLIYAALYAAVGAMCSTVQEAQQAGTPVTMLVVFAMISMFALLGEPNGSLAHVLSLVPFFAPVVVPVRYSIAPLPLPELALSIAVTTLGIVALVWIAARVYRVGILAYGKKPTLGELWRWVRTA